MHTFPIKPDSVDVLTFDCYGTLIDWETGVLDHLRPILGRHGVELDDRKIFRTFAELDREQIEGSYRPYREILAEVVRGFGKRFKFRPDEGECEAFADSMSTWDPFPDTVGTLKQLAEQFRLVIVSNVDDDIFAGTAERLEVPFDHVITAGQSRAYKPDHAAFEYAFERVGASRRRILHVAQSVFHDILPATALGLRTAWVRRRTHPSLALAEGVSPDLAVPDLETFHSVLTNVRN